MKVEDASGNTIWYGKTKSFKVKDMTDEHLSNIEKLIRRDSHRKYFCNLPREQWLNIIQREFKNRDKIKEANKVADKIFKSDFKSQLGHAFNGETKMVTAPKKK